MTILEYLQRLPEPARSEALENINPFMADREIDAMHNALIVGFFWNKTPQGYEYWKRIFTEERKKTIHFK